MSLSPIYTLGGLGMITIGVMFTIFWYLKKKISLKFFLWGSLAWIVSIALKGLFSYFFTNKILLFFRENLPRFLAEPLIWLYVGMMTGIFECGITLLFCFIKRIKETDFDGAVGFGIGFGGTEAILLGINSFITVIFILFIPNIFPKNELQNILSSFGSPLTIPAPIIERCSAMFIHIFSSLLIILSFQRKKYGYFLLSFIYKTFVDGFAGYLLFTKNTQSNILTLNIYLVELSFISIALLGLMGTLKIKKFFEK